MTQILASLSINAPIDAVWPWVADITKHPQWSPKPYSVALISGVNGTVGSKYSSTGFVPPNDKNHQNEVELTELVPHSKVVFTAHDANGYFLNSYKLESVGQGTLVTFQHDFPTMKGAARILVPILVPLTGKKEALKRLGLLKAKVEGK